MSYSYLRRATEQCRWQIVSDDKNRDTPAPVMLGCYVAMVSSQLYKLIQWQLCRWVIFPNGMAYDGILPIIKKNANGQKGGL